MDKNFFDRELLKMSGELKAASAESLAGHALDAMDPFSLAERGYNYAGENYDNFSRGLEEIFGGTPEVERPNIMTATPTTTGTRIGTPTTTDPVDQARAVVGAQVQAVAQEQQKRKITIDELRRAVAEGRPLPMRPPVITVGPKDEVESGRFGFSRTAGKMARPSNPEAIAMLDAREKLDVLRRRASDGLYRNDGADAAYGEALGRIDGLTNGLAQSRVARETTEAEFRSKIEAQRQAKAEETTKDVDSAVVAFNQAFQKYKARFASQLGNTPQTKTGPDGNPVPLRGQEAVSAREDLASKKAFDAALDEIPSRYRKEVLTQLGVQAGAGSSNPEPSRKPESMPSQGGEGAPQEDEGMGAGELLGYGAGMVGLLMAMRKGKIPLGQVKKLLPKFMKGKATTEIPKILRSPSAKDLAARRGIYPSK